MSLGWGAIPKLGSEGMASEFLVVRMGQTSKPLDMIILPSVASKNQPLSQTTRVVNDRKFSINYAGILLVRYQVLAPENIVHLSYNF